MHHHRRPNNPRTKINPIPLHHARRGQVAAEDFPHRNVPDEGQLHAEADHDAEHQGRDEDLEGAEAAHRALLVVEEEDDQHFDDADGAAGDEGDVEEQVEGDGGADDLFLEGEC